MELVGWPLVRERAASRWGEVSGKAAWATSFEVRIRAGPPRPTYRLPAENKQLSILQRTPRKCELQLSGEPHNEAAH